MTQAFRKLKMFHTLLKSAVHVCEKSKDQQLKEILNFNTRGISDFANECDICKQALLTHSSLSEFL